MIQNKVYYKKSYILKRIASQQVCHHNFELDFILFYKKTDKNIHHDKYDKLINC